MGPATGNVYEYTNTKGVSYYLNSQVVTLKGGRNQRIYYFTKNYRDDTAALLPEGFEVVENQRTGLPVLKRVRS